LQFATKKFSLWPVQLQICNTSAFPDLKFAIPGKEYGYFGGLKSAIFQINISRSFRRPMIAKKRYQQ
jgi:hypothetical protein